jgi:uncharacterized tellurite resistance protein B-like protein
MPLTPEQEWTLVACGLVAHADGVLRHGECEQVLAMIDERLQAEEHERWVALIADRAALRRYVEELPPLLPLFHEPLFERVWAMVLADGDVGAAEEQVVDEVAEMVGASPEELKEWRERWTAEAAALAEHKAGFAALLIHHDGTIDEAEAVRFQALIEQMPVSQARREEMLELLHAPPSIDRVGARLAALPRERRIEILRAIAPLVSASQQEAVGRAFFLDLAEQAGLEPTAAARLLER